MKGFFTGVLFAAPVTALLMWLVMGNSNLVDAKVERATAISARDSSIFNEDFDNRWAQMGGSPATCTSTGARHIADLRERVAELQREVDQDREAAKKKTSDLDHLIEKAEVKNENH